jgi:hypothetical protein
MPAAQKQADRVIKAARFKNLHAFSNPIEIVPQIKENN